MKILGIDPGTIVMGFGLIESHNNENVLIEYGALKPPARSPIGERLNYLFEGLNRIIAQSHPEAVAIEQPFVDKNIRTALAIGRAQAIAILAAAHNHIPSYEYTPADVKQRVANYGASSKEQIQQMVMFQLGLNAVPDPPDAADALAVALCHSQEVHIQELLNGRGE